MTSLIKVFWQVCLFRLAPQDLPSSYHLLTFSLLAYGIASALIGVMSLGPASAFLSGIVDVALLVALTRLVLWVRDLGPRFVQTVTALAGTGVIITIMALPFMVMQQQAGPENPLFLPSLILLMLMGWNLAIVGHILRHALSTPFFVGFLMAILYLYVSVSVIRTLFVTPS